MMYSAHAMLFATIAMSLLSLPQDTLADDFYSALPPPPPPPRSTDTLIASVIFHRHGDRSPTIFMPNSEINNARWPFGTGQLTPRGMHNEFILGQGLRSRYVDQTNILSKSYNRTQYYVRSTDFERTIQSAFSAVAGLYPPGTGPSANLISGKKVSALPDRSQPVPVHTIKKQDDALLLGHSPSSCPKYGMLLQHLRKSGVCTSEDKKNSALLKKMEEAAGYPAGSVSKVSDVELIYDPLNCEREHGMEWIEPFRTDQELFTNAKDLYNWDLRMRFHTHEMRKTAAGGMLAQVIYRLERAAGVDPPTLDSASVLESDTDDDTGHVLSHFSAHDTTVTGILALLGSFNVDESAAPSLKGTNPPYASSVVVELFRDSREKGSSPRVRAFYNQGVKRMFQDPPLILKCCGDAVKGGKGCSCTLSEFVTTYRDSIPEATPREACKVENEDDLTESGSAAVMVFTWIGLAMSLVICLRCAVAQLRGPVLMGATNSRSYATVESDSLDSAF